VSLTHNVHAPQASKKKPLLCYVTDRRSLPLTEPSQAIPELLRKIEQVASAGVDFIQIREKDLSAQELAALTRQAVQIAASVAGDKGRTRILVNDRLDVGLTEGADGVHLAENSLHVAEATRLVAERASRESGKREFLVGASCHSLEMVQAAARAGADYVFLGPVFATPSKAEYGEPQGLERLAQICRSVAIPVFGIGGITLEKAASCIEAGAAGLAAIRLFQDAPDPAVLVRALLA
jgi:thiamine-phosphate pyrophosphorylase